MIRPEDEDDIPAFLRLTPEERRQAWLDNPPKPMPAFGRDPTETERLYHASIAADKARKRAQDAARFAELRTKAATEKAEREALWSKSSSKR